MYVLLALGKCNRINIHFVLERAGRLFCKTTYMCMIMSKFQKLQ